MPEAYSLHIGCDRTNGYAGPIGGAGGCDQAARDMHALAHGLGYSRSIALVGEDASWDSTVAAISDITGHLKTGDLFLLTMAGHGMEMDGPGEGCEEHDQALLLYDAYLVDNTVYSLLSAISSYAFVVIVAESCYSGSIHTNLLRASFSRAGRLHVGPAAAGNVKEPCQTRGLLHPDVLLIAATAPTDLTTIGTKGLSPAFTRELLATFSSSSTYEDLRAQTNSRLPRDEQTCVLDVGLVRDGSPLLTSRPFVIPRT
jgi:hypothetical protein